MFTYPIQPPPRTAVLVSCFRSRGPIRVFSGGWSEEVRNFDPEALAAAFSQLEPLARNKTLSLRHAVIVVKRRNDPWAMGPAGSGSGMRSGFPSFSRLSAIMASCSATECEAHQGLHVESEAHGLELPRERIDASPCACGRKTPRLEPAGEIQLVRHAVAVGLT